MSSTNDEYEQSRAKYNALLNAYTGTTGYNTSLENAQKGASLVAQNTASQTKAAARNAGLSKSAAAALGQSNVAKAYGDAFSTQQSNAQKAGEDAVTGQAATLSADSNEGNNKYNRSWGNVSAGVGAAGTALQSAALMSDENSKEKEEIPSFKDRLGQVGKLLSGGSSSSDKLSSSAMPAGLSEGQQTAYGVGGALSNWKALHVESDKGAKDFSAIDEFVKAHKGGRSVDEYISMIHDIKPKTTTEKMYSDIPNYVYKYKDSVIDKLGGTRGIDGRTYAGSMAQDLEKIPGAVMKDGSTGMLEVDTGHLSTENAAAISELFKRVAELEYNKGGRK